MIKFYHERDFLPYDRRLPYDAEHYQQLGADWHGDYIAERDISSTPTFIEASANNASMVYAKARYAMGIREKDYDNPLIIN